MCSTIILVQLKLTVLYDSLQLHVRNEAFAHQKIAAQVLSDRVHDLESQLATYQSEEVFPQ